MNLKVLIVSLLAIIQLSASCSAKNASELGQATCQNTNFTTSEISDYQRAVMADWEREKAAIDELVKDIPKTEVMPRVIELSKKGNPVALYSVGQMLLGGVGGLTRNDEQALLFFELAASKGHALSLDIIAERYAEGDSQSLKLLVYCYDTLAATFGSESAKHKAKQVEKVLLANFPQVLIDELHKLIGKKFSTILLNRDKTMSELELITLNDEKESQRIYQLMVEYLQSNPS